MFEVKKIQEKLNLDDLKVNDSNPCKGKWEASKDHWWSSGDACLYNCCSDCDRTQHAASFESKYY
ncbi:hypothetical protein UT300009_33420 [Paraclostridium bifermentans]|uniref:hypothetical protein n=1 Tax=Paraclostridium bifermentans TaxID=1490 RepID=UPI003C37255B